jgi:outer membrane lipoprotein-sorting protein
MRSYISSVAVVLLALHFGMAFGSAHSSGGRCSVEGVRVLREWLSKCTPRSYYGVQSITVMWGEKKGTWKWRVWHDASGKVRMEIIEPAWLKGDLVISDGQTTWRVSSGGKVAFQVDDKLRAPWDVKIERFDLLAQNYKVTMLGREEVAGRDCQVFSIEPYHDFNPSLKLWLDVRIPIQLRIESYNPDGGLAWRMEYEEIKFDEPIPSSLFQLNLPKDCKVIKSMFDRQGPFKLSNLPTSLGFPALLPTVLPPGYVFDSAFVITSPKGLGSPTLHLIYTNGVNVISVFERHIAKEGRGYRYRGERGRHGMGRLTFPFHWQNVVRRTVGDVEVVLISRLSKPMLEKVADSISAR